MGMIQPAQHDGFLSEPRGQLRRGGDFGRHHFEGDMSLELVIKGEIHFAHATLGKLAYALVTLGLRSWHTRLCQGGINGVQLNAGAAEGDSLPGLNGDCADDLPTIELGAESPSDILDGKIVLSDM